MTAIVPLELEPLYESAPRHVRARFHAWQRAIAALDTAQKKRQTARIWARRLGVTPQSLWSKRSKFRRHGLAALLDRRHSSRFWAGHRIGLPPLAIQYFQTTARENRLSSDQAICTLIGQLQRWRRGDASASIPGYDSPPLGNPPPGWSARNLARYLPGRPPVSLGPAIFELTFQVSQRGKFKFKAKQIL